MHAAGEERPLLSDRRHYNSLPASSTVLYLALNTHTVTNKSRTLVLYMPVIKLRAASQNTMPHCVCLIVHVVPQQHLK